MKQPVMNPYLPLWEYIPDGEPRIFDGRLFVYGSHDYAGGEKGFCPGDYMAWSAPLEDLSQWTCHGVLFPRSACPGLAETDAMAAPDVVRGPDGRYYLYWNTNAQMVCRVAVSDSPAGPFVYYGEVCLPDGTAYADWKMFDPGVLVDEDGRVYLYVGFCMPGPIPERFRGMKSPFAPTSLGFELAADMKTIVRGPVSILPGGNETAGTGFEGHGFYEASSPRKIRGKYVMAYSSEVSHEMAYALADDPLGPYTYAGALVSSGDFGLEGAAKAPVMPYGNVHGGLVQLGEDWYIFYHRQTHGIECCRQGCAERLPLRADGWFAQAEVTSCGLNGGPLPGLGSYNACYCCHLTGPAMDPRRLTIRECRRATEPHIFQETASDETRSVHYIANITGGTVAGYKYFDFSAQANRKLTLRLRGQGRVKVSLHLDIPAGRQIGRGDFALGGGWQSAELELADVRGPHALYIAFEETENPVQFESLVYIP